MLRTARNIERLEALTKELAEVQSKISHAEMKSDNDQDALLPLKKREGEIVLVRETIRDGQGQQGNSMVRGHPSSEGKLLWLQTDELK
jgi:hypothetical protein